MADAKGCGFMEAHVCICILYIMIMQIIIFIRSVVLRANSSAFRTVELYANGATGNMQFVCSFLSKFQFVRIVCVA